MTAGITAPISIAQTLILAPVALPQGPQLIPNQNAPAGDYTFALSDGVSLGTQVYHAPTTANTYTIPPNRIVGFPVGESLFVVNGNVAGNVTIAIDTSDSDTLITDGSGATTSIVLGPHQSAYFTKVATREWRAYPGATS